MRSWRESAAVHFWVQEHGDTISGRKEAVPPPNVGSCLSIKADMMMELSACGEEVNQVAEEEPSCWHHLGCKGELTNEREQLPLDGFISA